MVELTISRDGKTIETRSLEPGSYKIGRLKDNDITLDSREVSRSHAVVIIDDQGGVQVQDAGSANGVLIDGKKVDQAAVKPGQAVTVKPFELRFAAQLPAGAGGDATVVMGGVGPGATVVMAQPAPRLKVVAGDLGRPELELAPDKALVVGRSGEADVSVSDPTVSRRHAEFSLAGGQVTVRDLGSSGGTLVNGAKVSEAKLSPGDRVTLGSIVLEMPGGKAAAGGGKAPKVRKVAPAGQAKGGSKRGLIYGIAGLALVAIVALVAFSGGDQEQEQEVAQQVTQQQLSVEEEEKKRLLIINLTKAREAMAQQQYQQAVNHLQTVLMSQPDHAEAKQMLAQAQQALAEAEAARIRAQQEAQAHQERIVAVGQAAQAALKAKDYPQAMAHAKELLKLDPNSRYGKYVVQEAEKAIAAAEAKKKEAAEAVARRDAQAKKYYNQGVSQLQKGDQVSAINSWYRVLKADPQGATPYRAKAQKFISETKAKVKLEGDKTYAAAQAQIKAGQNVAAMRTLRRALDADPWHSAAKAKLKELESSLARKADELYKEGLVLESLGDTQGAVTKWKQASDMMRPGSSEHKAVQAKLRKYR